MIYRTLSLAVASTLLLAVSPAWARVSRIEIIERKPFADGMQFGKVGSYEYIRGRLHYAVDPAHPRNQAVVDLHLAGSGQLRQDLSTVIGQNVVEIIGDDPRNQEGEVTFSGDFILLKPTDLARGNHRLLYDVNNRGNLLMLGYYNNASFGNRPTSAQHAGNGWLMRQGYSLLWSAWNWDVESVGRRPLRINLPLVVEEDGEPLKARIYAELAVQSRDGVTVERIAWGGSRCYPAAEAFTEQASLSVRDGAEGERQEIPREEWQFAELTRNDMPISSPVHVYLPSGFEKGKIYELVYTATNPRVVGLGLAAVRDAISFFHFDSEDDAKNPNPLAPNGVTDSAYAYIFGISQSGRFVTQMIYQGFHVDEQDRLIFEGARPHVAGAGKGGFNYRFAQTTHHQKHLQGNYFLADHFPFNFTPAGQVQRDPYGQPGRTEGDVLAESKRLQKLPKILITNHEGEYWTRSASLLHTDVEGKEDAEFHQNVRAYMINGVRHGTPSRFGRRSLPTSEHLQNQLDPRPVGRALLTALDEWVSHDVEPPASRLPRIDQGQLISPEEHRERFPRIPRYEFEAVAFPAARHPGVNLQPARVDFGTRFWSEGIQDFVPPRTYGPRFVTRVPAFNESGNPVGGIQLPQLAVPLGTNQAFNPRSETAGAANFLKAFESSFWPFAQTRAEREANGDPRASIEERYRSRDDYVRQLSAAADRLVAERFLLAEDATAIVKFAESLAWPPEPTDRWPFWKTDGQNN